MQLTLVSLFCAAILACLVSLFTGFGFDSPHFNTLLGHSHTLSPPVKGQLKLGEQHIQNITVTRTLSVGEKQFVSTTSTNAQGEFSFPPFVSEQTVFGNNQRLWQDISLRYNGQIYVLWYTAIDHEIDNLVLEPSLEKLTCDLRSHESEYSLSDHRRPGLPVNVYSICDVQKGFKGHVKKPLI